MFSFTRRSTTQKDTASPAVNYHESSNSKNPNHHHNRILSRSERNAFFALVVLNISFQLSETSRISPYPQNGGAFPSSSSSSSLSSSTQVQNYNKTRLENIGEIIPSFVIELLQSLVKELELSDEAIDAYLPMISPKDHCNVNIIEKKKITEPFRQGLQQLNYYQQVDLIGRLMVYFIAKSYYNGFTKSLLRQLCRNLEIHPLDALMMEKLFCDFIFSYFNAMINNNSGKGNADSLSEEQKRNKRYKRYLKIGAASVGAGALLAVTGGLAAPAIAGALVVMGTSTLAATVSVTTMAALFGGAGAGLTGYKMLKRTRGISEFEFEQCGEDGKMAVIISVSGWLNNKEDYKRSMGIVPDKMSPQERLFRFYSIHMPERIPKIQSELISFEDDLDTLFGEIADLVGINPMDNESLIPPVHELQYPKILEGISKFSATYLEHQAKQNVFNLSFDGSDGTRFSYDMQSSEKRFVAALRDNNEVVSEKEEDEIESLNSVWHWSHRKESQVYELYLLRWETDLQLQLGSSILALIRSLASSAVQNVLAATVFTALASAVLWPAMLIKLTDVIDNLWTIAIERADLAGKELAHALLSGSQGDRPVTLIGYSFGARVIFSCLRELAATVVPLEEILEDDAVTTNKDNDSEDIINKQETQMKVDQSSAELKPTKNPLNLIQDVILLGSPINSKSRVWAAIRKLVGGRIVNGYSSKDMILGIVYRYQRFQYSVSGVTPVDADGIENLDLSDIISKHTDYGHKMTEILDIIDIVSKPHGEYQRREGGLNEK